jgi:hypothetical protein
MFKSIKNFLGSKRKKPRVLLSQDAKPLPKSNFEMAMDAALDDSVLPRNRAQKLLDVYPLLCQPCFKYNNTKDTEWAMEYMLALWNSILDMMNAHGDRLQATARTAAMKCIISIVKRNEFRLESLGFSSEIIGIDKSSEKICKRYCSLLAKSLIFATKRMNEVEARASDLGSDRCIGRGLLYNEDYAQGEMYFYSEILAISYFRLPGIAARLITRVREILLVKSPELLRIDGRDSHSSVEKTPKGGKIEKIKLNNSMDNTNNLSTNTDTKSNKQYPNTDPVTTTTTTTTHNNKQSKTINIGFRYFMPASMNISFTSMSGRVLNKNTSVMTKISLQTDEELKNTKFVELNPSLFFWKFICTSENNDIEISNCFNGTESLWLDKFSVSGYFYASFVHAWITHIKEVIMSIEGNCNNKRLIRFTTIPGFVIILKLFLSLLRDRYLNELDTIKRRITGLTTKEDLQTEDAEKRGNHNIESLLFDRFVIDTPRAVNMLMNASKELLVICPYLFNFWIAIALENTSLHYPQCVDICFVDVGEWLNCLKQIVATTDMALDASSGTANNTNKDGDEGINDLNTEILMKQKQQQQILPSLIKTNLLPKALTILTKACHHRQLICAFRFIYRHKTILTRLQFNMCYDLFENHLLRFNVFFEFFLHWDNVVRLHFFHIIVFRLFSIPRQELRLKSDQIIVENLLEVVLTRKRRHDPDDDLNINLNLRLAGVIDDHLSRIYHYLENPGSNSVGLPENKLVYCKFAYSQYTRVIQEYYKRATATTNGVVAGPRDVVIFDDDKKML